MNDTIQNHIMSLPSTWPPSSQIISIFVPTNHMATPLSNSYNVSTIQQMKNVISNFISYMLTKRIADVIQIHHRHHHLEHNQLHPTVKNKANVRYQVTHLTRDTIWESKKKNTRKYHAQESQEVSLSQQMAQCCREQTRQHNKDKRET